MLLCPDTVLLLDVDPDDGLLVETALPPTAALADEDLLVPNELLLAEVTLLPVVAELLLFTLLPDAKWLPDVSRREPLYTSLPWKWPGEG